MYRDFNLKWSRRLNWCWMTSSSTLISWTWKVRDQSKTEEHTTKKEERKRRRVWRRRATGSDIFFFLKTEHSGKAAVPGNLRLTWQVLQRIWTLQLLKVLVENKVWKQGCGLAIKRSTWSDGAYRSPSYQLGKPRGCCPSAGRSNSGLGGAVLDWTLADIPGLSYTCTTVTRWGRGTWSNMGMQVWKCELCYTGVSLYLWNQSLSPL